MPKNIEVLRISPVALAPGADLTYVLLPSPITNSMPPAQRLRAGENPLLQPDNFS
jgi:hypothetical protein